MTALLVANYVNPGSYRGEPGPAATRIGIVDADTGEARDVDLGRFGVPGQVNWQPALAFADGRRLLVLSMEAGLCHLPTTRTNLWAYDPEADTLEPLLAGYRPAPYATAVALLDGDRRLVTAHIVDGLNQHVISDLDGGDARPVPLPEDGFSYCLQPSPDGTRVAFHTAHRQGGYRIRSMAWDGAGLVEVAADPAHLFFGPTWSPDGTRLLFADCRHRDDPEHLRADLCVAPAAGGEVTYLTTDRSHWLSPVYGGPDTKGGGSEIPHWLPDGERVTWVRLQPGARTPWPLQAHPEVDDHWNRDFRPEQAAGGTDLCLLRADGGGGEALTRNPDGVWDFRMTPSPDGARLAFCRSRVGQRSELWVMAADGSGARFLTAGHQGGGVDHPRWLQGAAAASGEAVSAAAGRALRT